MKIKSLPKLVDLRGKTARDGEYKRVALENKTEIAIHHSLTDEGDSEAFARYHVNTNQWPGIGYHFVILKDGTIEWNHDLDRISYHVGSANKRAVGICVVGDFRYYEPTPEQKKALKSLHEALKQEMTSYERTLGHNEFPGYEWKACPCFDYRAVLGHAKVEADVKRYRIMTGTFPSAEELTKGKQRVLSRFNWTIYERADHSNFNPPYRLVTGTFVSKEEADRYAAVLKEEFGWIIYVIDA
ncbi:MULTISPECIES: peptidoglycan recognition protein family protein [Pontibacillus]|uniref:Autolysin n=1 Tax=Pontibacillus chungwhensis TaxID=265426 RepID=A0ABY8V478_9BACI|nr:MULTISPECIES: N-acetylmuramoyl-L-alanine amidase [Pontibacillus]MCD5325526.1 N-acetylmuramoyl-L-alanine amidase [Pontibacillus sp. HN14]WIF98636.1 N-acetylmuramoyl-L-alanine amidase [Pontibacillus chungwhensis]